MPAHSPSLTIDLHSHTRYSHGADTPRAMHESACQKGLTLLGFSEHSPRPVGFDYTHEYREQLTRHLPDYVSEVLACKANPLEGANGPCRVLFGMEMDWLAGELDFTTRSCRAFDFDYLIGSVHFLDRWGFDDGTGPWEDAPQDVCEQRYVAYFAAWEAMLRSGLFNIAAHPDLIKIFSVEQFHIWLQKPQAQQQIRTCLLALRDGGMAMEISSAGLRKPCHEIYPAPLIMQWARETGVNITFASDAHSVKDVGRGFPQLRTYALAFGFGQQVFFDHGVMETLAI